MLNQNVTRETRKFNQVGYSSAALAHSQALEDFEDARDHALWAVRAYKENPSDEAWFEEASWAMAAWQRADVKFEAAKVALAAREKVIVLEIIHCPANPRA